MSINVCNNNSMSAITSLPSGVGGGSLNLISTQTASDSANITFSSNIDSTYDVYVFKFYDIHPETDDAKLMVNFRDGSTAYDAVKTTTFFNAQHRENGTNGSLGYRSDDDLAQSTAVQPLGMDIGNGNDECGVGELKLFNPSSTTFVKHFIATMQVYYSSDYSMNSHIAGYCNTTSAIDGVQFTAETGNFNGTIKLYGIS